MSQTIVHDSLNMLFVWVSVLDTNYNQSSNCPSAVLAGFVLQGPSLARGVFQVLPVQALTGGQALLHQG